LDELYSQTLPKTGLETLRNQGKQAVLLFLESMF
jgi:hypothetical protein